MNLAQLVRENAKHFHNQLLVVAEHFFKFSGTHRNADHIIESHNGFFARKMPDCRLYAEKFSLTDLLAGLCAALDIGCGDIRVTFLQNKNTVVNITLKINDRTFCIRNRLWHYLAPAKTMKISL